MAQPSRASTSRAATLRPATGGDFKGRLHIDPKRVPEDKHYTWVRETILGQPDSENVSERMMEGYAPVPADRHPEMMPPVLQGQSASPYIRRGGQILMEKPRSEYEAELDAYRHDQEEIVASVDRDRQNKGHRDMPATSEFSSRVERNGRFQD